MTDPTPPRCDHKFVDSNHCLKCGWEPPATPPRPAWSERNIVVLEFLSAALRNDRAKIAYDKQNADAIDAVLAELSRRQQEIDRLTQELADLREAADDAVEVGFAATIERQSQEIATLRQAQTEMEQSRQSWMERAYAEESRAERAEADLAALRAERDKLHELLTSLLYRLQGAAPLSIGSLDSHRDARYSTDELTALREALAPPKGGDKLNEHEWFQSKDFRREAAWSDLGWREMYRYLVRLTQFGKRAGRTTEQRVKTKGEARKICRAWVKPEPPQGGQEP